jgi:hypothetical protein
MVQMYLHARAQILRLYKQKIAWHEVLLCHSKAVYQWGGEFPPPGTQLYYGKLVLPYLASKSVII